MASNPNKLYLAFIEFLASFLGSGPILTGCHMALQCTVPCKSLMAIWTLVRFFTYSETYKAKHVFQCKMCNKMSHLHIKKHNQIYFSSSPVCFRKCSLKWPKWSKCFLQYSQTCTFFWGFWFRESSSASK